MNHTHLFNITGPLLGQAAACEPILRSLPDWFGIEEAIVYYVKEIDDLPTFLALDEEEGAVGFMSCLLYTSDAADDLLCVDLGGRRILKKTTNIK